MPETLTGPAATDAFLAAVPAPMGPLARDAAAKLRAILPGAHESCENGDVGFGVGPGYKGLVFTLTPREDHVTLGIADSAVLKDPTGLLEGKGARHRHVRLTSPSDLQRGALDRLLKEAAQRKKRL